LQGVSLMSSSLNRTVALLGLTASIVLPFAFSGTASATSTSNTNTTICNSAPSRADFKAVYTPGYANEVTISYINTKPLCSGIAQSVSFNTYATQGATWTTSGVQRLETHQTFNLTSIIPSARFIASLSPSCFYQTDAYLGATRFDGVNGALPFYPKSVVTPTGLLAAANGGSKVCNVVPSPTPTPIVTPKPTSTPVVIAHPTPTPISTGAGQVLSAATTLPAAGAGDLALAIAGAGSALGYIIARRNR
jgi:hypothetical protein